MTNPPLPPAPAHIKLPGIASGLFFAAPLLLLIGGFLGTIHGDGVIDFQVFQTRLGTVLFWIGIASLMTGFILVGVRAIAQQQLDVLRGVNRR